MVFQVILVTSLSQTTELYMPNNIKIKDKTKSTNFNIVSPQLSIKNRGKNMDQKNSHSLQFHKCNIIYEYL